MKWDGMQASCYKQQMDKISMMAKRVNRRPMIREVGIKQNQSPGLVGL